MSASDKLISNPPKAFLTDVFGTVVNWRKTVVDHLHTKAHDALNSPAASIPSAVRLVIDGVSWPEFAQKWRDSYSEFCHNYTKRESFKTVDELHLESLHRLIVEYQLQGLWTDDEIKDISLIWHKLEPWPDTVRGLDKLAKKFITATLSNGNRELLQNLTKNGNLTYTQIISAEDFGTYKPRPEVYLGAAKSLPNVEPSECCLIAAHLGDLKGAKACGYKTVYIERDGEEAYSQEAIAKARTDGTVDLWIGIKEQVRAARSGGQARSAGRKAGVKVKKTTRNVTAKAKEVGRRLSDVLPTLYATEHYSSHHTKPEQTSPSPRQGSAVQDAPERRGSNSASSVWSEVARRTSSIWDDVIRRGTISTTLTQTTPPSTSRRPTYDNVQVKQHQAAGELIPGTDVRRPGVDVRRSVDITGSMTPPFMSITYTDTFPQNNGGLEQVHPGTRVEEFPSWSE